MVKEFNQNKSRNETDAAPPKTENVFFGKIKRMRHSIAGLALFSLVVLHFVSQFTIFKIENPQTEAPVFKPEIVAENKPVADAEKIIQEEEPETTQAVKTSNPTEPNFVQPKPKPAPARVVIKKKEPPRETRAERLRRAERILTGV